MSSPPTAAAGGAGGGAAGGAQPRAALGRRFWRAGIAYLVNSIGDQFYAIALPLALLQLGYAASTTTFLQTVVMATTVASGFLIGHLVDQHRPGPLLAWSYAASAAVLLLGLAATVLGVPGYPVALVMAAALGLLAAVSAAAIDAGVPELVAEPAQTRRAYSLIEAFRSSATVLGPAAAGVVALVRGLGAVFGINAASFLLASAVMGLKHLHRPRHTPSHDNGTTGAAAAPKQSMRQAVAEGLGVIVRDHRLRLGVALSVTINITLGAVDPLVLVRLVRDFEVSAAVTAALVAAMGILAVAAMLALTRLTQTHSARRVMAASAVAAGVSGAGLGLAPNPAVLMVLFAVNSTAAISYNVHWRSYRQRIVDPGLLGRTSATCRSVAYTGVVLGTLLVGAAQQLGVSSALILLVGGAACTAAVLLIAALLHRHDRSTRQTAGPEQRAAETTSPDPPTRRP